MSEPAREHPADALEIREWSGAEWHANESAWSRLLADARMDALFLSWEWLTLWWRFFGSPDGRGLHVLAAYRRGELVGLAPVYGRRVARRLIPMRSLQFIGTSWRDERALISEYLDVIAKPAERAIIRAAFFEHLLARHSWSELVVNYTNVAPEWAAMLADSPFAARCYARTVDTSTSYQADLGAGFDSYLRGLGQSTRRSVWHLRRRLAALGSVQLTRVVAGEIEAAFAHLNRLHRARWGTPAFAGNRLRFHRALAENLARRGELAMSLLRVGDAVVSVLYDIRKGACQYNIKMGFDPAIERGFSLGLIHFGYALELAAQNGVTTYDFLAGPGRRTDFKQHLGRSRRELATVQLLKGPMLRRIFRWYDDWKRP